MIRAPQDMLQDRLSRTAPQDHTPEDHSLQHTISQNVFGNSERQFVGKSPATPYVADAQYPHQFSRMLG
jgi:hypothetical protein